MAVFSKELCSKKLNTWLAAEEAVATGQSYQIGTRMLTRADLKQIRAQMEYCHPYSAFERGSNENANILIRRWLPKGTKLSEVSQAEIKQIQIWMNNYPRMVLGGRCANTALAEWMAAEGVLLPFVHI